MRERVAVLIIAFACFLAGYTSQPQHGTVLFLIACCQDFFPGVSGFVLAYLLLFLFPFLWDPGAGSLLGVAMYWFSK